MKTQIIPEIKDIEVKELPLRLSDFYISDAVFKLFPRAAEIFEPNTLGERYPIDYFFAPLEEEEYRIIARTDRIEIAAAGAKGLEYGLFTLSELDVVNDGDLCEFNAFDKPSLPLRALSDDISRGQISTLENFFTIIRRLARYKYNTYMPYMEDVFRFRSLPDWGKFSGGMDAEEWKVIIRYAAEWNISIRPIVNLLGHFDKSAYVEGTQPLALRYPDGRVSHVMDPRKPEVKEAIRSMLEEIVDCFGPGLIHGGGDEPLALTEVCGKKEGGKLFIDHYTFVAGELQKRNCTLMMYADFFAPPWGDYSVPVQRVKELPEGIQFVFWDYAVRDAYPFVDALHRQGLDLYLSPGTWTWKRLSCDIKTSFDNTKGLLKADHGRAKGMIMSSWADGGDTLRELTWPGVLIGANFSWSPESSYEYEPFYYLYHKSFFGFDEAQAMLLDPIYHHDYIVKRKDTEEFKMELFRDPFAFTLFGDWENIPILQAAMKKALVDWKSLQPRFNQSAFDALELSIARVTFTADKIAALPRQKPQTMEEAASYADGVLRLAGELPPVKELHRRLWFAENRESEWMECASHYDDLYDRLQMLARNLRVRKYLRETPYPEQL